MRRALAFFCMTALGAAAVALAAADPTYIGRWKLNLDKSDFGQTTITFSQTPSKEMRLTVDGQSYTFKTDGQDYPALLGTTAAWKAVDASTWETTNKIKGKVLSNDTAKVSGDGKVLTVESKGTKPDGTAFDDTVVYERVSGTSGFIGKWKTRNLQISSPGVMELTPNGPNGLTWSSSSMKATSSAKFDGKDYPATGETFGPGFTMSLKKDGLNGFIMTIKHDGKALYLSRYVGSADGATLTETGSAVGVNEKYRAVYDKIE
jgi:hypothetical protein